MDTVKVKKALFSQYKNGMIGSGELISKITVKTGMIFCKNNATRRKNKSCRNS